MKDFNFAEKLAQRKEKAEAQAKKYFYDVKQRKAYYWAEGSTCDDLDNHNEVFLHFTDEEIARIKELIINDVNDSHTVPQPVSTVKEALEVLTYGDLFDQNEELRKLLLDRCEKANLYPYNIDFDTRHYFYKFGCLAYDYEKNKTCDPITVEIILSDEEYLSLLSLQLMERENFNFNQLLKKNQEFAVKLNKAVEGCIYGWRFPVHVPFAILFDEVRADAEYIDGSMPADVEIFSEKTDDHFFHIIASAASHILTITEEEMKQDANFASQRILCDIDADKTMELIGGRDYADMLRRLKGNFHEREAFDSIKSWLRIFEISFSEKTSE